METEYKKISDLRKGDKLYIVSTSPKSDFDFKTIHSVILNKTSSSKMWNGNITYSIQLYIDQEEYEKDYKLKHFIDIISVAPSDDKYYFGSIEFTSEDSYWPETGNGTTVYLRKRNFLITSIFDYAVRACSVVAKRQIEAKWRLIERSFEEMESIEEEWKKWAESIGVSLEI